MQSDGLTYFKGREAEMATALEDYFGDDFASLDGATRLQLIEDCWGIGDEPEYQELVAEYAPDYAAYRLAEEYRDRIGKGNLPSYAKCFQD